MLCNRHEGKTHAYTYTPNSFEQTVGVEHLYGMNIWPVMPKMNGCCFDTRWNFMMITIGGEGFAAAAAAVHIHRFKAEYSQSGNK